MKNRITKQDLLNIMIDNFICPLNLGFPISISNIANLQKETYYMIRKYMKELEKDGFVKQEALYYPGHWNYEHQFYVDEGFLIKGWNITDKCKDLKEYKEITLKHDKIMEQSFVDDL